MAGFGLIQQLSDGIGACCIARSDLGKVFPPNHTGWELRVLQDKHMQRRQGKLKRTNIAAAAAAAASNKISVALLVSFLMAGKH